MTKKKETPMKYEAEMNEFISIMDWKNVELNVDRDNQTIALSTGVDIDGQSGRAIIEANSQADIFDFYIYYEIKCKDSKRDQVALLMHEMTARWAFGRFEFLEEHGRVRWRHRVDFEGSNPSGVTIRNNLKPGWNATEVFANVVASVALTNQSTKDAIAEHDREREERDAAASQSGDQDDEGPKEL